MANAWAPIVGFVDFDAAKKTLSFDPRKAQTSTPQQGHPTQSPWSVTRSNIEFGGGEISMDVYISEPSARVQLLLQGPVNSVLAGINAGDAAYGFMLLPNNNNPSLPGGGAAPGGSLPVRKWLNIRLRARGSILELFYEDVLVISAQHPVRPGPLAVFIQSSKEVKVKNIATTKQDPECFVVMQFTDEYNTLYAEVIKPVCEKFGYKVVRADEFYSSGLIIDDITKSIQQTSLVIAEITPDNPNVFYEVGYAHGTAKPTILLCDKKREKLPFDVAGFRTIFYDNSIGGKSTVEEQLRKHLEALTAPSQNLPFKQ